jgi:hypothetical protein
MVSSDDERRGGGIFMGSRFDESREGWVYTKSTRGRYRRGSIEGIPDSIELCIRTESPVPIAKERPEPMSCC